MENYQKKINCFVSRIRHVQRFLSTIPRCRAIYWFEKGFSRYRTFIKGFNMIIDGELDRLPESAFNLKGTIEQEAEAGEKSGEA
jgi:F-type H+-transporting ATPase subunit beta